MGLRPVIVAVVLLVGCGAEDGLTVARWHLGGEVASPAEVELPSHLDGVAARDGTYTLSTSVDVPARWRGQPLTLVVSDLPAIARLSVDGEAALATEVPSSGAYRTRGPLSWRIGGDATADGLLDLVITVENRWTQSAWWNGVPVLVAGDARPGAAIAVEMCNLYLALAAVISLAQIGFTSLFVYLLDRKRRAYLWFGAQCLLAACYPLYNLGFTQQLFGIYDLPVLAASILLAVLVSIYFTHEFFELARPWKGWVILTAVCLAIVAICHDPYLATPIAGPATVLLLAIFTAYQLFTCARLSRRHPDRQTARIHFLSWILLAGMMPPDLIYWLGLGDPLEGARPATIGTLGFGLCLSLLLGRRHLHTLRLEAEHHEKARSEVEQLNVELRRQVAQRSNQLFAALALAGGRPARAPELEIGALVQDRYRIVRELGRGGMGTVYEVERVGDARRFALKLTHEITGPALARLAREALIASRIAHRNLVGVIDVDVAASGFLFVVMELVEGTSLKMLKERHGDPTWALPLLAQIADGLAELHAAGVVHRDLKPANVLITPAGEAKITDFGVSRHVRPTGWDDAVDLEPTRTIEAEVLPGPSSSSSSPGHDETGDTALARPEPRGIPGLTKTGILVGTPAYIAPEMVDGPDALTQAVDLYAFGVLAWELIVGEQPLVKPAAVARLHREALVAPPTLASRWPHADPSVVALVDRCLSPKPLDRPDADEAAAVLDRYLP